MADFLSCIQCSTGGRDFNSISDMRLEFSEDVTEHSVSIDIYDNMIHEGDRSFGVQLYLVSGTRTLVGPSAAVIMIVEDDQPSSECVLDKLYCTPLLVRNCYVYFLGMSCHFASTCGGVPFPVESITECCSELKGSSISFTADGGTCQPCISKSSLAGVCMYIVFSGCTFHLNLEQIMWLLVCMYVYLRNL